jgi:hypothetical protein
MTFDEHIESQGVMLPIDGWEDLLFDYLQTLEKVGYAIPIDKIMEAVFATQELADICLGELGPGESRYVH